MSKKITCEKCGKLVDARGMSVHKNYCKGKEENEKKEIESEESITKCVRCGGEKIFRLDDQSLPMFVKKRANLAMKDGYTHICNCGTLLK